MKELLELREILKDTLGASPTSTFPLHEPMLEPNVSDELNRAIQSGMISSVGPAVTEFESRLTSFTGVSFAISTSTGTAALQLALHLAGVRPGDEVAIPALSFIATANAVTFLGATPVFFDTEQLTPSSTLGASFESLEKLLERYTKTKVGPVNRETGSRLAAVVPVHVFGRLAVKSEIRELASTWKVSIVEDSAGAIGCFDEQGNHPGSSSTAILSFNGNKTITTGGGGALLTNSPEIASLARHLSTTAKLRHPWRFDHDLVGWNFRMPAINAAVGVAQMQSLQQILHLKASLYRAYEKAFSNSDSFEFIAVPAGQKSNYWLSCVRLRETSKSLLASLLDSINQEGFEARSAWTPLHLQAPYKRCQRVDLTNAELIAKSIVCLPSSPIYGARL